MQIKMSKNTYNYPVANGYLLIFEYNITLISQIS